MTSNRPAGAAASADPGNGRWKRVGADIASGARAVAPPIARLGGRIGDWLAAIGWGKFFLLAILLLIFGGIASQALFDDRPAVVVERPRTADKVQVQVSVSPAGIRIGRDAPVPSKPPIPPMPSQPGPPQLPDASQAPSRAAGGAGQSAGAATAPDVRVGDRGVEIVAERDGKQVSIKIDRSGVRVEEAGHNGTAGRESEGGPAVVLPPSVIVDPEQLNKALEAAREKIEEIVSDQVSRQAARTVRVQRRDSGGFLMTFLVLAILSGIIVKVVLGSKKKAEVRAQAATATAAEEGLKRQLAEAQLKMMQAQVEPHFLFNTLASVDFLIETDPSRASKMQKNLIQYLRAALPQMREGSTTLGKEIALCRSYLEILKVRMEDRLQFTITVPQGLASAQFPPMMLQSLVENAIKHGLEPKPEGGTLTIAADVSHGTLRVRVADTGLGFGAGATAGTGVGLANVHERLRALYGIRARMAVEANMPSGTIATIEVPYEVDLSGRAEPDAAAAATA